MIGGDFNIMRFSDDKNKSFLGNKFIDLFSWVINTHGMRDVELNWGKYSWSNNLSHPTLERLDRVVTNDKWENTLAVRKLHVQVCVESSGHSCGGPLPPQFA